ncbi:hypothetical protein [Paenochrobactrum pullorum]|uniref:hypothetical protein n=1 Tax=Paenochrobactrum pullorum TaxID=1324351 RepID=UPI0035BBF5D2
MIIEPYLYALYDIVLGGARTGIAIFVGFVVVINIPQKVRVALRLEDDWRTNRTSLVIKYFFIGAAILSLLFSLVDTETLLERANF